MIMHSDEIQIVPAGVSNIPDIIFSIHLQVRLVQLDYYHRIVQVRLIDDHTLLQVIVSYILG